MSSRSKKLGQMPINKLIITMSIPIIIGMIVSALYNVVDTIFVGQAAGPTAIAALSTTMPLFILNIAIVLMIGSGASSIISRLFGAKKIKQLSQIATLAMIMATVIGTLLAILSWVLMDPLLYLLGARNEILPLAKQYLSIIAIGFIFNSLAFLVSNLMRAEGNAKKSTQVMIIGTILNLILDPIFIFGFKLGLFGAGLATVIAQAVSMTFGLQYIFSRKTIYNINFKNFTFKLSQIKEIVLTGSPAFIRNVAGSITLVFINNIIISLVGTIGLSIYGIIDKIILFFLMPSFGLVAGIQPIIGFNYSAKNYRRVIKTVQSAMRIMLIYFSIAIIMIFIFGESLFKLFTRDENVTTFGINYIRIVTVALPIIAIQIIASATYQALGKIKPAVFIAVLRQLFVLIPLVLIMVYVVKLDILGLLISFPIADLISSLISWFIIKKQIKLFEQKIS